MHIKCGMCEMAEKGCQTYLRKNTKLEQTKPTAEYANGIKYFQTLFCVIEHTFFSDTLTCRF